MKPTKYTVLPIMLIALIVGLQACKSKKKLVEVAPIESKIDEQLFADVMNNQFNFSSMTAKVNLGISSGTKSLSSKSTLRILKDRTIQLSVQPLFGVEMLRLYIDHDSIVLLDRMNKRYVKESITDVKSKYPVGFDFDALQALLTNRLFMSGKVGTTYKDYNDFRMQRVEDKYYLLKSVDRKSGIEYSFAINGIDHIERTQLYEPTKKYTLMWSYEDFAQTHQMIFPHKMNVLLKSAKRKADIDLEFTNIVLNESFELSDAVPQNYSRAHINDLIKIVTETK